ncbi:MAG: AmmeMemoRadiSam system protein B [Candidatus Eisenbacteria bacterium]|nr:AmmeMemoRadiSam system protein B [Candidatus Eisenbacteria bacterium]
MEERTPTVRDDIELHPLRHADRQMVLVRDPLGLIKEPIVLNEALLAVLSMLDGTHTISDLRLFLTRSQGGVLVTTNEVQRVLNQLSTAFLLQDERFVKARDEIVAKYAAQPVRHAFHEGVAYPADREQLASMLDQILAAARPEPQLDPESLEPPAGSAGANWPRVETITFPQEDIIALAAPHMEIDASAHCYGVAYNQIMGAPVELVFILGTGHSLKSQTFSLTMKDFETPLGTASTEKQIVEELLACAPGCVLDNDMPHRHEHSIEFEVVFLQHVLRDPSIHIVPILCGSFRSQLDAHCRASEIPCVGDFLKKLRSIIEREVEYRKRKCLVVAGVDFSHIGLKFGDQYTGRTLLEETVEYDRALIENLCNWDANGFWQTAKNVSDRYKVCGFAPLASMLEMFESAKGHLLGYDVWHEDATHSAVSFASMVFTRK